MLTASRARKSTSSWLNNSGRNSQPSRLKVSICACVSFMVLPPFAFYCHSGAMRSIEPGAQLRTRESRGSGFTLCVPRNDGVELRRHVSRPQSLLRHPSCGQRMRQCGSLRRPGIAGENMHGNRLMFGPGAFAVIELCQHGRHRAAHVRPLRRDHLLDRGIARETVDRAMEIDVERDQFCQPCCPVDGASGLSRGLELRAAGHIALRPFCREPRGERVDRAADFIKLADTLRIELGDL